MKKIIKELSFVFVSCFFIFWLCFYKESIITIAKLLLSLWWLFVIPGYLIIHMNYDKFDLLTKIVFGTVLAMAIYAIVSYPLGLFGVDVRYHVLIIPLFEICFVSLKIKFINK